MDSFFGIIDHLNMAFTTLSLLGISIPNFWLGPLLAIVFAVEMTIQRIWPDGGRRHRALGRFTMTIYCILFVTGSTTYTMLYILYPGKIG